MTAPAPQRHPVSTRSAQPPTVLSVGYPYAPVGACAVGGAEVILSWLEAAMPDLGFQSIVVAHHASKPSSRLYGTVVPEGEITDPVREEVERIHQRNIDLALAENPVALIHMHGLDFHRYTLPADIPVLVTLHLPPAWYPESIWNLPPNVRLLCVSETQRQACPAAARNRVMVINNGVPLPPRSALRAQGHYALMLSRVCPEKNLHAGLQGAAMACMPAILAGEVFPYDAHHRYFRDSIAPRLNASGQSHQSRADDSIPASNARFIGPVTGAAKTRLLTRAACLLQTSLAAETSSLASMEALAAGVPVIAVASGALPEILEHGRTGFLIDPADNIPSAIAAYIQRLPEIDREVCRAVAEERFPVHRMLNAYAQLYRKHARHAPTPPSTPPMTQARTDVQPPVEISIQRLTDSEDLENLREEWTALWQEDPHATPFQHPAWLLPWWHQFGPDGDLCTLAARDQRARLLGILPLYTYMQPDSGDRKLLILGAGTSDYLDAILDPLAPALQVAGRALDSALAMPGWTSLHLLQLRSTSPLLQAAESISHPDQFTRIHTEPCSVLRTSVPLPPKVRANARRYRHRAEAAGTLTLRLAENAHDALTAFEELAHLHRERWNQRGEAGVLADPRVLAHHREAIPQLFTAGLLRIFSLLHEGHVLAVLYALADPPSRAHRTLYLYLIGVNTSYAELSPGTLLLHDVWEYARSAGFASLDLLRGGEAYKHLWGAEPNPTYGLAAAQ